MRNRPSTAVVIALIVVQSAACFAPPPGSAPAPDQLNEFEWRRAHGSGTYLSGSELDDYGTLPLSQVLSIRLLGFASTQAPPLSGLPGLSKCGVDIYVNGSPAPGALDQLQARDLAGVEFYQAATAPPQYRRVDSACPILLLWLKLPSQDR